MTDPLGQSQIIPYLIGLSRLGYSFMLISCEKEERFLKYKEDIHRILQDAGIDWYPLTYHKKPPVLSAIYDIYKIRKEAIKIYKEKGIHLVHCRSYLSSLVGMYLKKRFNIPFIFDMRGFWADERVDGGLWNLKNPLYKRIYKFFKSKESAFLKYCDAAISLTESGKAEMGRWKAIIQYNTPIYVIPCSCDFDVFQISSPEDKEKSKEKLGIRKDQLVIGYLGSIGTWYMLDEMLELFGEVLKKYSDAVFLFITPDSATHIIAKAKERGIPSEKIIVRFAQRKEVNSFMSCCDISVFFIKPTYSKISSSPTKLGELFAMGIPVICNSGVGDVEEIVASVDGGLVIKEFNRTAYERVVKAIDIIKSVDKAALRARAFQYYDLGKAVDAYYSIYKKVL